MSYEANRRVETSARTFAIVERLAGAGTMSVSTLADDLDMSKGIVHNHLSTLRELGYVRVVGNKYELSAKLLTVGLQARANTALYRYADGLIEDLADRFELGTVLFQRSDTVCSVIATHRIPPTLDLTLGTVLPVRNSLIGLVMIYEDQQDSDDIETAYTATQSLDTLAEYGYSIGPISTDVARRCIALPIVDDTGECNGCVGVVLPDGLEDYRLERITEAAVTLRQRVESRYQSGWTTERSFATEKHAWVGE